MLILSPPTVLLINYNYRIINSLIKAYQDTIHEFAWVSDIMVHQQAHHSISSLHQYPQISFQKQPVLQEHYKVWLYLGLKILVVLALWFGYIVIPPLNTNDIPRGLDTYYVTMLLPLCLFLFHFFFVFVPPILLDKVDLTIYSFNIFISLFYMLEKWFHPILYSSDKWFLPIFIFILTYFT